MSCILSFFLFQRTYFQLRYYTFRAMKERIKNKLRDAKKEPKEENYKVDDVEDDRDVKEEEYYLGKDRDDERRKRAYVSAVNTP